MGVGSIRGGGRGGPKGSKGAGGAAGKASAGKAESLAQATREVGTAEATSAAETPGASEILGPSVIEEASHLAKALKSGEIKTKQEAAQKLVAAILKDKLDLCSEALATRIADQLQEDPRLAQTLERIWQKG